jgi:hypothetical protein
MKKVYRNGKKFIDFWSVQDPRVNLRVKVPRITDVQEDYLNLVMVRPVAQSIHSSRLGLLVHHRTLLAGGGEVALNCR